MFPRFFFLLFLAAFCLIISLSSSTALAGDDWKLIDPADLASKTPLVDKDADAEAIFWEVQIDDGAAGELVFSNYIRVKVFNERGKESQSRIDLTYFGSYKIKDIAARTIKPDGTIVELKKEDVFERTIVKLSGAKLKAKSFAMPNVEPGSIIEYRWKETRGNASAEYVDLQFQRDIPIRSITYLVRPYTGPYAHSMRYQPFQIPGDVRFEKAKNGFYRVSLTNVPPFHEEPRMPPEDTVRSWILLYYTASTAPNADKFWSDLGKRVYENSKDEMKVNDDVRRVATETVGDATDPQEKLRRLYDYCQSKIKNASYASAGLTAEEREKFKPGKSPADTIKKGIGTGGNIDSLFAALATAAGFEAHLALSGNRQYIFLDRQFADPYFLLRRGSSFIAVSVGEKWLFFSPSEHYTPFGMLGWREEGQSALIIMKEPAWVPTPISLPEKSVQKRTGKITLQEDGTLEGDVQGEYSGQFAIDRKLANDDDSPEAREKSLTDEIKLRISNAELTNIKIENVLDPVKPFTYSYHVRVAGYAQKTGKRLFLQPGFFTRGLGALFSASGRKNDVYFHYPWSEVDHLTIDLPAGYALDNADAPAAITPKMTQGISEHSIKMGLTTDGRTLVYDRKFFFGGLNNILFPVKSYGAIKTLFDMVNKGDDHTITLKQAASTASN